MAEREEKVKQLINQVADEQGYKDAEIEFRAINTGGSNFTSELYLADVSSKNKETLHLFAKIVCVQEPIRTIMNMASKFKAEEILYTELTKTFRHIEIEANFPEEDRFVIPKCYKTESNYGEETVVLDNLVANGYDDFNRFKSVGWDEAASAMETLAKYHALSFAFDKRYPEEFEKVVSKLKKSSFPDQEGHMKAAWMKTVVRLTSLIEDEVFRNKSKEMLEKLDYGKTGEIYFAPVLKRALIHGDFRPSNLMYKKENGKLKTIVVDYQLMATGCVITDLLYFIALGTDEEFRKRHYYDLLEHYHNELTKALKRLRLDPEEIYPKKVFKEELEKTLSYLLVCAFVVLPFSTVEAQKETKLDENLLDKTQTSSNVLLRDRINEIVRDCQRFGVFD